jgi:chromosome segregation ATPase
LFRIINEEGGSEEAGFVVNDCLRICNNIVNGSETCQRLFFAMGSDWILRLADFFNPSILEKLGLTRFSANDDDGGDQESYCWFDESSRLSCAIFSQMILYNALNRGVNAAKHQNALYQNAPMMLSSSAFWIARNGPRQLVSVALSFLGALVTQNPNIAMALSNLQIKITPPIGGKNVPRGQEAVPLHFSWKPLPNDDRRHISFLSLLADRYVYPVTPWHAEHGEDFKNGLDVEYEIRDDFPANNNANKQRLDLFCLSLFERVMSCDSTLCDMTIQYILAPPPPPMLSDSFDSFDDYMDQHHGHLESMRPLGSILSNLLINICDKLLGAPTNHAHHGIGPKNELETAERVVHLLSVIFMHGSQVARELSTAITTFHARNTNDVKPRGHGHELEIKPLLPLVLATVGKAARQPAGIGYPFVACILQLLATVVTGCERATRQLFEDPSNLFVVDLATSSSEIAGVPPLVQVLACLFLGCCCTGFPVAEKSTEGFTNHASPDNSIFSRRAFLSMIDSRIGLNRFNETLKKPLALLGSKKIAGPNPYEGLFDLPGFKEFYEHQMDAIKTVILELYSGGSMGASSSVNDSIHLEVIATQKAKIQELETKLSRFTQQSQQPSEEMETMKKRCEDFCIKANSLQELVTLREQQLNEKESTEIKLLKSIKQLEEELAILRQSEQRERDQRLAIVNELRIKDASLQDCERMYHETLSALTECQTESDKLRKQSALVQQQMDQMKDSQNDHHESSHKMQEMAEQLHRANQELLRVKESCLQEAAQRKTLQEQNDVKDRKLVFLEEELTALRNARDDVEANKNQYRDENKRLQELMVDKDAFLDDLQMKLVECQEQMNRRVHGVASTTNFTLSQSMTSLMNLIYSLEIQDAEEISTFVEKYNAGEFIDGSGNANIDDLLSSVLQYCQSTIGDAVAVCSDLAEGAAIYDLEGKEGGVVRVIDCCQKLRMKCTELQAIAGDIAQYIQLVEELQAQVGANEEYKRRSEEFIQELERKYVELKSENQQLHEFMGGKEKQFENLVSIERAKWDQRLQELETERSNLQETISGLRDDLLAMNDSNHSLQTEYNSFKKMHSEQSNQLQAQIMEEQARYSVLQDAQELTNLALVEARAAIESLSTASACKEAALKGKIFSLEESLVSLGVDMDILREELRQKERKIEEQSNQILEERQSKSLQSTKEFEQLETTAIQQLKESLENSFATERLRLEETIAQLQSERETNEDLINSLTSEVDRLKIEKDVLEKNLMAASTSYSSLQSELVAVQATQTSQSQQLANHCQELELRLVDSKSQLDANLFQELADAQLKIQELEEKEKDREFERLALISQSDSDKSAMLADLQRVQTQLHELELAAKTQANELEEEIRRLKLAIEELNHAHYEEKTKVEDELTARLVEEWQQKIAALSAEHLEENATASKEIFSLKDEVENEKKRHIQMTQRILDLEEELKATSDERMKVQKEKEKEWVATKKALEEEIQSLLAKHKEELGKVKESIRQEEESKTKHLIAKVMALQEEKKKLEERVTAVVVEKEKEKEKDHVINQQDAILIQNLQNSVKSLTTEKDRLKLLVASKNDEIKHLNQVIVKLQDEYAILKEMWDGIAGNDNSHPFALQEQELKRLSDALTKSQHDMHHKEEELKNLLSRLSAKDGEIASFRDSLDAEKKSYESLSKQYDELYQSSLEYQRKLRELSLASSMPALGSAMKAPQQVIDDDVHSISHHSGSTTSTPIKSAKKTASDSTIDHVLASPVGSFSAAVVNEVQSPQAAVTIVNPAMLATPSPNAAAVDRQRVEPPMSIIKTASPAVKDAARLNAEIIREVCCCLLFLLKASSKLFWFAEKTIFRVA